MASRNSGLSPACLTLYWPPIWRATSSESLITSTSVAPSRRASSNPSSSPLYSATLFVVSPMWRPSAASSCPSAGSLTTAPIPAGPGFPRAPPSTWTTSFLIAFEGRWEGAGRPSLAAVADHAALVVHGALGAAAVRALATVDDDGHVRVVLVVGDHLVVELVRERLRDDAVDHRRRV